MQLHRINFAVMGITDGGGERLLDFWPHGELAFGEFGPLIKRHDFAAIEVGG
ncbi:hypothetical protein D3C75_1217330 [compost metagenome]